MKQTQKNFMFLINLIIMASLCFAGQYSVSAQSQAQAAIDVSPPLFPDLTWKNLGNVQKDVHVYDQILNLSGNMFAAIEIYQNGIPQSVFDYYSARNLETLGWNPVGRSGFESIYWHSSGRYLTVQIEDCPNFPADYCVNVWQSVESSSLPPSAAPSSAGRSSTALLSTPSTTALAALNKLTPTNASTIALPTNSTRVLTWTDAGIGSTDRYQYCIDETNDQQCNSTWKERNSTYSGDGEFTLVSGHTYYWQVRVRDANVYADSGTWWSFTVGASTVFEKTIPTNVSTIALPASTQYFLQWSALPGIASTDRYQYCIDETNNQSCDSNNWITRDSLYSGPSEFTLVSGHTYYWQVRARDANIYSNSGSWWTFTISSSGVPTVSSIVRGNPTSSTTNAASVIFTVTFSTSVTGVDLVAPFNDFGLATSGITGASITTVTGSGTTYNVTVNTGVGDGTIRLDVVDNDSIKNIQNIPLGGVGIGNGNFVGGQYYTIDKAPIVLSILQSSPSPVNLINVNFAVTFSESVAILGINDLTLITTGVSGAAMTGVSGSGSVYTVTINTGTGNGTIHLNLKDDDSIRDVSGNPLGGPGLGNGDFTSGETYTINRNIETYIGGSLLGSYNLPSGGRITPIYNGINNGPVRVVSTNAAPIITSERAYRGPNLTDFNEMMGFPANQLTTEYWFPLYDTTSFMQTYLTIGNASASQSANVDVYIAGQLKGSYVVPVGGRVTPIYDGINNGPVRVVSTNAVPIITSERAYRGPNLTDFNEMMGFPANQLTTEYWFPLYDTTSFMQTYLTIGNASASQSAEVSVYIAGQLKGSYVVPVGGRVTPIYDGINNGPVRVVSTNAVPIITSERAYRGPNLTDFNEMMGFPANKLTTEYWFPLYDTTSFMQTYLTIGNASASQSANVDVYIAGQLKGSYVIPVGGRVTPIYDGINNGPVRVVSTNAVPIITSERAYRGPNLTDFNEMMGFPANQLTTEYWFPLYDTTSFMQTYLTIGNAQ